MHNAVRVLGILYGVIMKIFFILMASLSLATSIWSESTESDTLLLITTPSHELEIPYGLPSVPWPKNNPYTPEKAELGRLLYFDTRLSTNGTISCASCHAPSEVFSDRRPLSIGIQGQKGTRHSMTIINTAYQPLLFWDGRAKILKNNAKGRLPIPKR